MKIKYQFFISSTYKDLIEERQIAINIIMKMGQIPAGMELFTATGEEQFESIKPIIDESDYYILILAGKYGTVIKEEKIGYTEKEFDYALSKGKKIIPFVYSKPDDMPSNKRETKSTMKNYFNRFRDKVLKNRMAYIWTDKIDLAQGISASITRAINDYPSETYWVHVNKSSTIFNDDNDSIFGKIEYINIFSQEQCIPYYRNIPINLFTYETDKKDNSLLLKADFTSFESKNGERYWAGFCTRALPCRDWRKYIINGSLLKFSAVATGKIDSMWFEIKSDRIEMCKKKVSFKEGISDEYCIDLNQYSSTVEDWKWIREICFVIYPEYVHKDKIKIKISNLRIES